MAPADQEERDAVGSNLRVFSGQIARLLYHVNDVESFHFATDVANALHGAGWNINEPQPILVMAEGPVALGTNPPLATGIHVVTASDDASRGAATAFIEEMNGRGFDSSMAEPDGRPNVRVVTLWFEPRPEGPQGSAKIRAQRTVKKP